MAFLSSPQAPSSRQRLFALDILRGVAALLVLFRHMPQWPDDPLTVPELAARAIYGLGWTGVDLFFVLSGFLISGLLYKEYDRTGRLNLGRFWLRRGLKIWPSYFVAYGPMVLAAFAYHSFVDPGQTKWLGGITPNLLFIQNYYALSGIEWPHSWSLAVEEHFYLALPLLLLLVVRPQARENPGGPFDRVVWLIALTMLVALVLRILAASHGANHVTLYYQTQFRCDSLAIGVLLGWLFRYRPQWAGQLSARWRLILCLAPWPLLMPWVFRISQSAVMTTVGFSLLYLGFGAIVFLAAAFPQFGLRGPRWILWASRPLGTMGVYSYTIYLAHSVVYEIPWTGPLREAIFAHVGRNVWVDRLLFFTLSIGGGILLSHIVERPVLRLRDRWLPSSRRQAAAVPPALAAAAPAAAAAANS